MANERRKLRERLVVEERKLRDLARRLVDDDDPDDLVQEAMQTALQQADPPAALVPWLRQVLRNLVRGRARRRTTQRARLIAVVEPEQPDSPEISLDRARMIGELEKALMDLEEPYRSTVYRRFFEEMTPIQIARADGDLPATVRWRVHEGLRRIRSRLDERLGTRDEWCGAMVLALELPTMAPPAGVPSTTGATAVSKMTLAKILALAVVAAVAAASLFAVVFDATTETVATAEASLSDPAASLSRAQPLPPGGSPAAGEALASMSTDQAPGGTGGQEPDATQEKDPEAAICDALAVCSSDLPPRALRGVDELEIVVQTWTLEDGGALIERVDVTTGSEDTGVVDEETSHRQGGEARFDELATCISYSLDTDRLPPYHDAMGRIAVNTTHLHPYGLAVPIDRGRIDETVGPCSDEPDPEPLRLVDVSDASTPHPEDAVAVLGVPRRGPADAAVRIIVCGAYPCPFCKKSVETLSQLGARYSSLSVAWLQLPLTQDAAELSFAAVAAHRQGRFWELHRELFQHEKPMSRSDLLRLAEENGLDVERFEDDLNDPEVERQVALERQVCSAAGAKATPTFFINGDFVPGERGVAQMTELIDQILEDASP